MKGLNPSRGLTLQNNNNVFGSTMAETFSAFHNLVSMWRIMWHYLLIFQFREIQDEMLILLKGHDDTGA